MSRERFNKFFGNLPIHIIVIGLCILWLVPTIGLLVTSVRPFQAINTTGWWTAMSPPPGEMEYQESCAGCHGP